MTPFGFHVRFSLEGRRVLAATESALRLCASVILTRGARAGLIAFRVGDTHLHALLLCLRKEAGAFVHAVECALGWRIRPGAPFEAPHFEPVCTQSHLSRAFWYVLRQEEHHGTRLDPMHEGSSLYDTLGLRAVDCALPERVARALPRVRRAELAELLAPAALGHIDAAEPSPLVLERLSAAASSALALTDLARCHSPAHGSARQCAIKVALTCRDRWSPPPKIGRMRAIADALGLTARAVQRLARRAGELPAISLPLQDAIRMQWQLRSGLEHGVVRGSTPLRDERRPAAPPNEPFAFASAPFAAPPQAL